MKRWFCLLVVMAGAEHSFAQTPEDSVKKTVMALFDAMRKSDSSAISSCFADSSFLQSLDESGSEIKIRTIAIHDFAGTISALPPGAADERIRLEVVRVKGNLAVVWAPYQFFYKGVLLHCGVDSFQLVRLQRGWTIQYIIDTEHKQDCL